MYQTISMSDEVEKKLNEVQVFAVKLDLEPIITEKLDLKADWEVLHEKWQGKSKSEVAQTERIVAYQDFYQQLGLNTKKTPPSVQNLIQRFLIKEELTRIPVIHPIVDAVNVAAVKHLIPLGVFDAAQVKGDIRLTLSKGGEWFQPIGSQNPEKLDSNMLVLIDDEKVLSLFCYRDSEKQKITEKTRSIWILGCQVPGVSAEVIFQALDASQSYLSQTFHLK
ncbi:B3/B4 domain-containing protein [Bacillus changyiensis]|uniref:B3/B4 domain-containing protein n=1 Tax=Bacillus changyiensis TaxID=3004103 RepID=UPI0022E1B4E8|nr:phenylalanine--tRNA ligase beta subunit-related protein [Bacillus changyiensis]MDA1478061.1 phenylalanine--tRNA ligase beta subunit-related protein [Bacillus changyiensis]